MKKSKLSVLMCNYNHGRFLPVALGAIAGQSLLPDEIIVLDDASTDDSVAILEALAARSPLIRVEKNDRNLGVVASLNRLLSLASGDYVYFAAADDAVLPGLMEKSMRFLAEHPQAGLCSCLSRLMDQNGQDMGLFRTPIICGEPRFLAPAEALDVLRRRGTWMQGNTVFYRRDALLELQGFPADLRSFSDGFVHLVLALRHGACFIPEPLASWRRLESGFAVTTAADLGLALEILQRAGNLMRTTYREIFPEGFVADWEKMWLWTAAKGVTERSLATQLETLERLGSLGRSAGGSPGILMPGLRLLARLQRLAMEVYNFVRFGGYPWKLLRIQARSWLERRRLGITAGPDPGFSLSGREGRDREV